MPFSPSFFIDVKDTPGGLLPEKLGGGVRPASQNAYPIYDQNLTFKPTGLKQVKLRRIKRELKQRDDDAEDDAGLVKNEFIFYKRNLRSFRTVCY